MKENNGKGNSNVALIGLGAMGQCLAKGLGASSTLSLYNRTADKSPIKDASLILVAVKPHDMKAALTEIAPYLTPRQLVVSVASNISLSTLKELLPSQPVLRIMPNTAVQIGKGIVGCVKDETLSKEHIALVEKTLSPLGSLYWLPENKIDALTALAGSAPAFAFIILESMIDAGIEMGLHYSEAKSLACDMWLGAASLLKNSNKSPSDLKWEVTSPKGVTIAGIRQLEQDRVRAGVMNALLATFQKL